MEEFLQAQYVQLLVTVALENLLLEFSFLLQEPVVTLPRKDYISVLNKAKLRFLLTLNILG
jgi:hypothetical protein